MMLLLCFASTPGYAGESSRRTPVVRAVEKALPSVVNIGTERIINHYESSWGAGNPFDLMFRDFYSGQRGRGRTETSLGSGAIINKQGLIVTNAHVVRKATRIIVTTYDGRQFTAKEIAADDVNDLALLKLDDYHGDPLLEPISVCPTDDLMLGETVIAIGNPYGLGSSISTGILSAMGRSMIYGGKVLFNDIIQTDAPINPGNSGGPLVNINADMIGLNTAIHKDAEGIGFAIPLRRVEAVLAGWLIPERFSEVSLGIIPDEKVEDGEKVFLLREVMPESPAWQAGLRPGDEIVSIDGSKPHTLLGLSNSLWHLSAGDMVKLDIKGKEKAELEVKVLELLDGRALAEQRLGLRLRELTPKLARTLGYPFHGGLIVEDAGKNSKTLRRGDVIVKIEDIPIYEFSDISRAFKGRLYGDQISALVIYEVRQHGMLQIYKRQVVLDVK
ncbi:MAG: trypsin-like peptidase domain-containing protein [Victivallales bacterium]|nr:trypsin-like peptidase domain-containing protein [Victivallales bacterium]